MFSEVRHAILPLALRKMQRRGDLERAGLLIESLAKHWRDTKPFELLIVSPAATRTCCGPACRASQHRRLGPAGERLLPAVQPLLPDDRLVPAADRQAARCRRMLGFGGYLTLDSDVCCVGDFDATTFVEDGRGAVALGAQAASRLVAQRRRDRRLVLRCQGPRPVGDAQPAARRAGARRRSSIFATALWDATTSLCCWKARKPLGDAVDRVFALHQRRRAEGQPVRLSRRLEHLLRRRRAPVLRAILRVGRRRLRAPGRSCPTAPIPAASSSSSRATPASRSSASANTA